MTETEKTSIVEIFKNLSQQNAALLSAVQGLLFVAQQTATINPAQLQYITELLREEKKEEENGSAV